MRGRAGAVLVEGGQVALIERHRAGLHYFVFPGGGVKKGESNRLAAVREMEEETGLRVAVRRKLARVRFEGVRQVYYLVERLAGEFGAGTGKEYTHANPDDPTQGIYLPVWMAVEELSWREDVYPRAVAKLVARAGRKGWPKKAIDVEEIREEV